MSFIPLLVFSVWNTAEDKWEGGAGRSRQGYGERKEWLRQWTPAVPLLCSKDTHFSLPLKRWNLWRRWRDYFPSSTFGMFEQVGRGLLCQVGTVPLLPFRASRLCFGIRGSKGKAKDFLCVDCGWSSWLLHAKAGQGRARKCKAPQWIKKTNRNQLRENSKTNTYFGVPLSLSYWRTGDIYR